MDQRDQATQPLLEIVYLFIVPVVLIYVRVIPYSWRAIVLLCVALLILGIIRHQQWTKRDLGLAHLFSREALIGWGIFAIVATIGVIWYAHHFGFSPLDVDDWKESWRLILFFIPLSVLQEVAYRAFLTKRLRDAGFILPHRIILSAALFTLLHIIYPYASIALPIAMVGGLAFAWLYERYPDFVLACIVHAVLNFTVVLFGFFS